MLGLRRSAEFSANSLKTRKYNLWLKMLTTKLGMFSKEIFENC